LRYPTLALRTAANLSIGYYSVPNTPSRKRCTVNRQRRWKLLCPDLPRILSPRYRGGIRCALSGVLNLSKVG
jgi:hypothetical protein